MIKATLTTLTLLAATSAFAAPPAASTKMGEPISCSAGPALKTYGGTHWLAYACSDGKSLALISASDNPACPAHFILSPKDGKYTVTGQGSGKHDTIPSVEKELRALTPAEILNVRAEAASVLSTADRSGPQQ